MIYAFDLDSTLTTVETLPFLAEKLGILEKYEDIVKKTKNLPYDAALKERLSLFLPYPNEIVSSYLADIPVFPRIREFINANSKNSYIITSNLDIFVVDIVKRFSCEVYASKFLYDEVKIINKAKIVEKLRKIDKVAFTGDGENDSPALVAADFAFAASYAHKAAKSAINASNIEVFSEENLIKNLIMLSNKNFTIKDFISPSIPYSP